MGDFYDRSGVSLIRGDEASWAAFEQLQATFNENTEALWPMFVGLKVDLSGFKEPRFAIAVDGVGTKLKYAFAVDKYDTVGIDLVAMSVNDLVRHNVTPLGFGMYQATSLIEPEKMSAIVSGVVAGCKQAGCVYMSGETAEMPGFYSPGEFDLAGFSFGVYDRDKYISGRDIEPGDVLIGLQSFGLHSNGFLAVREVFPEGEVSNDPSLSIKLLTPTRIYVKKVLGLNSQFNIHGWAHITGGGIVGKLGRIIPQGLQAVVNINTWTSDEIFAQIQQKSGMTTLEMFSIFNMGLGMIGVVKRTQVDKIVQTLIAEDERLYIIGEVKHAPGTTERVVLSELRSY